MAYQDNEGSVQGGAPIEVYRFVGTYKTYRYTSYSETVTVNGDVYTPIAITRSVLKVGTQEESQLALEVSLPFADPMVQDYGYDQSPPSLTLEIIRAHANDLNDTVTLWKGRVTSFTVEGRIAKVRVPAIFGYILTGTTPSPRYQAPCNHILYDSRCGVLEASFKETTTITSFLNNIITVAAITQVPADLSAGMLRITTTGEARMITSIIGLDITVTYPFSSIDTGLTVDLVQGCDHSFATCKSKFTNGPQYGGCPLVPARNPFTSKI